MYPLLDISLGLPPHTYIVELDRDIKTTLLGQGLREFGDDTQILNDARNFSKVEMKTEIARTDLLNRQVVLSLAS